MEDIFNRELSFSFGGFDFGARSGGIMSSIMLRFLAVFVNIIEKLRSLFK